jgi:hypothetical protein
MQVLNQRISEVKLKRQMFVEGWGLLLLLILAVAIPITVSVILDNHSKIEVNQSD